MQSATVAQPGDHPRHETPEVRFASNDVRMSLRGWTTATILVLAIFWLLPRGWQKVEPLNPSPDYRIPYRLGYDYYHYARVCRTVCHDQAICLVGDSVIWGHYVDRQGTLSHYLNEQVPEHRFENLGVDGIHCVALAGLMQYYGRAVRDKRVILNCNLLWMSSPRHDLSTTKETPLNHPTLVPQFWPWIPCYRATLSERLGITIAHHADILGWADHLRIAYFDNENLSTWTIKHPYENPMAQVTLALPSPDEPPSPQPDARPWNEKGIRPLTPEWVALDDSFQWRYFRRTVEQLQQRGNRVFVLIGPLNEHMLTPAGRAGYNIRKEQAVAWHNQHTIPCYAPPPLPSHVYADLSHPTAEGYAQLAKGMRAQPAFRSFLD